MPERVPARAMISALVRALVGVAAAWWTAVRVSAHMKTKMGMALGILALVGGLLSFFAILAQYEPRSQFHQSAIPDDGLHMKEYDSFNAIDRILASMELGNIAFNTPRSMNLGDTAMIQLLLGVGLPIEELKRRIEAEGEREGARIRVSGRMEARLSGPSFAITAITSEVQAVSKNDVTEWKWEIIPKSYGRQFLHLTLSALLSIEGISTPRAIRTFDRKIEVNVALTQQIRVFVKENWQWLWEAILVPLVGWVWKKGNNGLQ